MSSIKPIGEEVIINASQKTDKIVTVKNYDIIWSVLSAVAEILSETYPVDLKRIGIEDVSGKLDTNEERKKFGLRMEDIAKKVKGFAKNP